MDRYDLRLRAMLFIFALVVSSDQSYAQERPTWCERASSSSERVICRQQELWVLDACEDMMFVAERQRLVGLDRSRVEADESGWVAERDGCGENVACLRNAYRSRILELERQSGRKCIQQAPQRPSVAGHGQAKERPQSWCDKNPAGCAMAILAGIAIIGGLASGNSSGDAAAKPKMQCCRRSCTSQYNCFMDCGYCGE